MKPIEILVGPKSANLRIIDGAALGYIPSVAVPTQDVPTIEKILPPCALTIFAKSIYLVHILKRGSSGVCAIRLFTETKPNPEEGNEYVIA